MLVQAGYGEGAAGVMAVMKTKPETGGPSVQGESDCQWRMLARWQEAQAAHSVQSKRSGEDRGSDGAAAEMRLTLGSKRFTLEPA